MKIDIEQLAKLSDEDRLKALDTLKGLGYHLRYSTRLVKFFEDAYDWQKDYFNAIGENKVVGLIAGNRVGKSEAAAAYVACASTGIWPKWYTGYKFQNKAIKIFVCGSTSQQLRVAMQEKLFGTSDRNTIDEIGTGFIPKDSIERFGKGRDGAAPTINISHISGRTSRIEMLQYTQSDAAFQGAAVDLAVIDEEPGEKFFQQILKRIAIAPHNGKPGFVICAFTPEQQEEGFVMKQMWNLPTIIQCGDKREDGTEYDYNVFEESKIKYRCINAGWPSVKHIDEDFKASMLYGTPQYLHETIMWGKPMLGGGLVYNVNPDSLAYNPEDTELPANRTSLVCVDFGFTRDPGVTLLMSRDDSTGRVWIEDGWKGNVNTLHEFAQKIWMLNPHLPVAWPKDGNSRKDFAGASTLSRRFMDIGVEMLSNPVRNVGSDGKFNHDIEPGLVEIRSLMHQGKFKINIGLPWLLEEIENYKYDTNGKPKPRQDDHGCDAMRYGMMSFIEGFGDKLKDDDLWSDDDYEEEQQWNNY